MPVNAMPFRIAAGQEPSSPAQWMLVVAIILLGLCCVLVFIGGMGFGCLGVVTAALVLPLGLYVATSLGAGELTAGLVGALVAEVAFLASSLTLAGVLGRRKYRAHQAKLNEWNQIRSRPRSVAEMRDYWDRGE
ncbi:hypothetical protein [Streptomyces shaanxiensis]|uniref:Uncharacterized protein n=1 Tax=Streptomyces shaanxiensis TaxID=653357 RepID=A0ABP7W2X0_9ACTN